MLALFTRLFKDAHSIKHKIGISSFQRKLDASFLLSCGTQHME